MKDPKQILLGAVICVLGFLLSMTPGFGQTGEMHQRTEEYSWSSGSFDGAGSAKGHGAELMAHELVAIPGVPWMQLSFDKLRLGSGSYLSITSLLDGAVQRLDAGAARAWGYRSAYFNGDMVQIELYVAPTDREIFVDLGHVTVGEWSLPTKTICGAVDDRAPSSDPRIGRILPAECTGYLADTGRIITAGHCLDSPNARTFQLNVPASNPDGSINHPGPADQYPIDPDSFAFANGGIGNDWGVFDARVNTTTGLTTHEAQGAAFGLAQNLGAADFRITGFGRAPGTLNLSQKTHLGPNNGSAGTILRYVTDTTGGNSGSPVIDQASGLAVGVHTHGGCSPAGGNNHGTSFFHPGFWPAANEVTCTGAPATPTFISGPDDDLCQGAYETYSTSQIAGATAYQWEVVGSLFGGRITHTNHITLNGQIFTPGVYTIRVRARNFCGWSGWRSANLVVLANSQCSNCSGRFCL